MSKAIVIGAGIAGIASAIRMAVKGHQVEIFEASPAAAENWFTMINVPSDTGQDWDELIKEVSLNTGG